jgi:chemotaxis signal transduction protein
MMNVKHGQPKSSRPRKKEQVLLFSVANQIFAIATNAVREIRSTDSLAGTATEIQNPEIPSVRHTVQRGQRTYYVVNAGSHFGLPATRPSLLLILRDSRAVVLIDRIERMMEISAVDSLPRAFSGDEQKWYRGLTYADDRVIPVIEPASFLSAEEIQRLDNSTRTTSTPREMEGAARV